MRDASAQHGVGEEPHAAHLHESGRVAEPGEPSHGATVTRPTPRRESRRMRRACLLLAALGVASAFSAPALAAGTDAEAQLAAALRAGRPAGRPRRSRAATASRTCRSTSTASSATTRSRCAARGTPRPRQGRADRGRSRARARTGTTSTSPANALNPGCTYEQVVARGSTRAARRPPMPTSSTEAGQAGQAGAPVLVLLRLQRLQQQARGRLGDDPARLPRRDAARRCDRRRREVGYSQHEGAERADWGDAKLQIVDGTHPVVYPAAGSHANYFDVGAVPRPQRGRRAWAATTPTGPTHDSAPARRGHPVRAADALPRQYPWLGYQGRWGERQPAFYNGPTGPEH